MHPTVQPTAAFRITAVRTINDPVERQRRLAQAYGLIMEFGRQKRAVAQIKSDVTADPRSEEESQC
jgi:hypothetical protein